MAIERLEREAKGYGLLGVQQTYLGVEEAAAGNIPKATAHSISAAKYFDAAKRTLDLAAAYKNKTEHQRGK